MATTFLLSVALVMCVTARGVMKTIEKAHTNEFAEKAMLLPYGIYDVGKGFIYDILCLQLLLDLEKEEERLKILVDCQRTVWVEEGFDRRIEEDRRRNKEEREREENGKEGKEEEVRRRSQISFLSFAVSVKVQGGKDKSIYVCFGEDFGNSVLSDSTSTIVKGWWDFGLTINSTTIEKQRDWVCFSQFWKRKDKRRNLIPRAGWISLGGLCDNSR
ncbi:uncharacterized protein LOC112199780 [Rosa chinensis]|uniref:uncharacterized protein LOC112199780 n=1 Tax=Rosa chinensis TaxID=74649 RepID=UPI001AD8D990|nr:uncharacterized protein LOC112199780 [Rosa chinensis]